jgi:hypothetical protein
MSAAAVLMEAKQAGVTVSVDGGRLNLEAEAEPPAHIVEQLRRHKAEIVALLSEPDSAELEVRKGMASNSAPVRYLDAWAAFQLQCPGGVKEQTWRQAIDDAGRFLAQWDKLAESFGWKPGDLFDVPRDGAMGLVWWLKGRIVSALGPEHASVGQPAHDRVTRREWVNPYSRPVRPVSLSPILEHQQKIMQRVLGR